MLGVSFSNPWVIAVDGARRRLPAWGALLIAFLVLAAGMIAGPALYMRLPNPATYLGDGLAASAVDRLVQFLCVIGPLVLAAVLIGRLYEGRPRLAGGV